MRLSKLRPGTHYKRGKYKGITLQFAHLFAFFSHCADAVLSLSNLTTLVGTVSPAITTFASLWVQSPSGYDFLIAKAMKAEWLEAHGPVISQGGKHTLYTKFSLSRPGGSLVKCYNERCLEPLTGRPGKGQKVYFQCKRCGSRCSAPKVFTDKTTTLGRHAMITVKFPVPQCLDVNWHDRKKDPEDLGLTEPMETTECDQVEDAPSGPPTPSLPHSLTIPSPSEMTRSISLPAKYPPSSSSPKPKPSSSTNNVTAARITRSRSTSSRSPAPKPPPPSPPEASPEPSPVTISRKRSQPTPMSGRKPTKQKKL